MLFSIVIPTCNRADALSVCLNALAKNAQTFHDQFEVIVTDDGRDTVEDLLANKYSWVRWIKGPRKGPAANRNNGAANAQGEWLIFIDDDCIPDKDFIAKYYNAINENPFVKVFEGRIYVDEEKRSLGVTSPVNLTGGYLWSCNFMIDRHVFNSLNGFDEDFPYPAMEDVDLKLRIDNAGYKILFVPEASVCHPWRKKGGWKKIMQHNASTMIYLKKHPEEIKRINPRYYLKVVVRSFLYYTFPGIFKYRAKGLLLELEEHFGSLVMAVKLIFKRF